MYPERTLLTKQHLSFRHLVPLDVLAGLEFGFYGAVRLNKSRNKALLRVRDKLPQ